MSEIPELQILARSLIDRDQWDELQTLLAERYPADIAELISEATADDREQIFDLVSDELKPDVLAELEGEVEDELLDSLTNAEISDIVEEMAPDDAADLIGELSTIRSEQVLHLMESEEQQEVRELLQYDEETAGGLMTTEFISFPGTATVQEIFNKIAEDEWDEPFYYAYITDTQQRLIGFIGLWELVLVKDKTTTLQNIAHSDIISVTADEDQEEVAKRMSKYDISAIPVVDRSHRLVGRITFDDVIDVLEEEASEDIFRMAGSDDAELEDMSPLSAVKLRLPWLLITLFSGFLSSYILKAFMSNMTEVITLTVFVPIVMAMGGNTGIQSSTLIIRGIALGSLKNLSYSKLLGRELFTGAIMGLCCGILIGLWVKLFLSDGAASYSALFLGFTVATSLFMSMTFAALYGAFVPILLERFKVDPAAASGPFVTASNDISALLIYYVITVAFIATHAHFLS